MYYSCLELSAICLNYIEMVPLPNANTPPELHDHTYELSNTKSNQTPRTDIVFAWNVARSRYEKPLVAAIVEKKGKPPTRSELVEWLATYRTFRATRPTGASAVR